MTKFMGQLSHTVVRRLFTYSIIHVYYKFAILYVALPIIYIGYDDIVLTKVIAEIW